MTSRYVRAGQCDLAAITRTGAADEALSRRAVEIVRRAGGREWSSDPRLDQLVSPTAKFDLGAGDVGGPLGTGVAGAHALTEKMEAGAFRFYGYDYMDIPGKGGCAEFKIQVEFVSHRNMAASIVEFTFRDGRLASALGWRRSLTEGSLKNAQ